MTVYECLNNHFTADFGIPGLNPLPITIDNRPCLYKISRYTPDLLSSAIYVAPENFVSTLTTPSDLLWIFLLPSDDTNPLHVMKKNDPKCGNMKRLYCYRKNDGKICYKKTTFYFSTLSDKDKTFYYCHGVFRNN